MKVTGFAVLVALLIIAFIASNALFTVDQTQQALVLRFGGEPVPGRGLITKPGLNFKVPFFESVVLLDKRILDVESPKQEVLASDNQRIEVDAFVRYKITDPLRFYQSVGNTNRAYNQLASILNSAVRRVLGEATSTEIIRDKRAGLMVGIREQVDGQAKSFGVTVVDVRIRRADLPREISEKIFSRMQSERQREATEYRAQGAEKSQRIKAKADRDVTVLLAEAQRLADQTRGEGEGERNRIFAEAFNRDPAFFAFYRSMQAYESGLKSGETRMVLSPNSDFFRYFGNSMGAPPDKPAAQK
jgi:modulator of FtsH protease HflC